MGQVVASFVEPLVENHRRMTTHPKYIDAKWAPQPGDDPATAAATVQAQLRAAKQASGGRVAYCFATRHELPGVFYLGHILGVLPPSVPQ